jgi:hypothetical protein
MSWRSCNVDVADLPHGAVFIAVCARSSYLSVTALKFFLIARQVKCSCKFPSLYS